MSPLVLPLYAAAVFLGAALLFVVQPMVGKMILPLLGGTPAVWSTCMVFFQAALLAGYAYAHAVTRWLGMRRQAWLHLALLAGALALLPMGVDAARFSGDERSPVLAVLGLLSATVGLPFAAVAATAPLLQSWFAASGHRAARDPYFLYAASNAGSMLALLAYPWLIEPNVPLRAAGWLAQARLWTVGYVVLAALIALCALAVRNRGARAAASGGSDGAAPSAPEPGEALADPRHRPVTWRRRLYWIALALAPSSLLLGVTTYVTTDIAAVPLLWVLPLSLYLLSFVLAFGRWPTPLHQAAVTLSLPLVLVVLFSMQSLNPPQGGIAAVWHFLVLFVVALACHGALARDRPPPVHLTGFYLLIALGGVLGGIANALIAPLVFRSLAEYPLAMVLACALLAPSAVGEAGPRTRAGAAALAAGAVLLALALYARLVEVRVDPAFAIRVLEPAIDVIVDRINPVTGLINRVLVYAPPLIVCVWLRRRPVALAAALTGVLAVGIYVDARNSEEVRRARSFFGVLRVTRDRSGEGYTELRHGTTLHGRQANDPARRGEPMAYYHRQSPIGQIFAELAARSSLSVAVIGLGTGALAAYGRPGDAFTFYEIDRLVRDIAFDPAYFTFTTDAAARGVSLRVELGDARVRLAAVGRERPGEQYGLIVVDAFSSDAIPVHLLTREAFAVYLERLAPDGCLALHISNRYLDLRPVVAGLAVDAGLAGRLIQEDDSTELDGAARSTWVVLARTPEALGGLVRDQRWTAKPLEPSPRVGVWTDDFHDLVSVLKWR